MLHYVWALGIKGRTGQNSVLALSKAVERASEWLWFRHKDTRRKPLQTSSVWSTLLPRHHEGVQRHGPNQASKYFFRATRPAISDQEASDAKNRPTWKFTHKCERLSGFFEDWGEPPVKWWALGWGCVWLVVTTVLLNIA